MMMVCPICGKRFFCQPEFWPYWRGDYYLCSENCKIVFDTKEFREKSGWIDDHYRKKEEKKVHKITLAQKKKAVDIAIGGGNPLKYLEECGSSNPSAHWHYIRKTLKEKDPEKYAQIPGAADKKYEPKGDLKNKAPDDAMEGFEPFEMKDGRKRPVTTCCVPSTREGVEVPDELPEEEPENLIGKSAEIIEKRKDSMKDERKTVNYDGYEVSAIRSEALGEFYFDRKFNSLDWRTAEGEEIGMSPDRWKMLMNELPKIMGILGI